MVADNSHELSDLEYMQEELALIKSMTDFTNYRGDVELAPPADTIATVERIIEYLADYAAPPILTPTEYGTVTMEWNGPETSAGYCYLEIGRNGFGMVLRYGPDKADNSTTEFHNGTLEQFWDEDFGPRLALIYSRPPAGA